MIFLMLNWSQPDWKGTMNGATVILLTKNGTSRVSSHLLLLSFDADVEL